LEYREFRVLSRSTGIGKKRYEFRGDQNDPVFIGKYKIPGLDGNSSEGYRTLDRFHMDIRMRNKDAGGIVFETQGMHFIQVSNSPGGNYRLTPKVLMGGSLNLSPERTDGLRIDILNYSYRRFRGFPYRTIVGFLQSFLLFRGRMKGGNLCCTGIADGSCICIEYLPNTRAKETSCFGSVREKLNGVAEGRAVKLR